MQTPSLYRNREWRAQTDPLSPREQRVHSGLHKAPPRHFSWFGKVGRFKALFLKVGRQLMANVSPALSPAIAIFTISVLSYVAPDINFPARSILSLSE